MRWCAAKIGPGETSQYRSAWETSKRSRMAEGGGGGSVCVEIDGGSIPPG